MNPLMLYQLLGEYHFIIKLTFLDNSCAKFSRPAGDLTISGLGWITVGLVYNEEEETGYINHVVRLRVHSPKAVETYIRPSMPVGSKATEWYEYMEVEDDELEASRPTLVF
jgi:hypothetical protein